MHDPDDLNRRFRFHPANTDERRQAHETIRDACRNLASTIDHRVPDGREKSLAITKLEEAMMWANAGIARQPAEPEVGQRVRVVRLTGGGATALIGQEGWVTKVHDVVGQRFPVSVRLDGQPFTHGFQRAELEVIA